MNKKAFYTIVLFVSITQQSIGQDFNQIEAKIDSLMTNGILPSMAIGILKDGEVIYERAFGYSDIENGVPSTIHTPYQLASLSKPITASTIMKLHENGIINLDDPITKYVTLKKVDSTFTDPTIRQVMNHTAGLGTYFDIYYADERVNPVSFAEAWAQYGIQLHQPGKVSEYSNLGYGLLDDIISKATAVSFKQNVQETVFEPLKMNDSFLIGPKLNIGQKLAKSYGHSSTVLPHLWTNTPGAGNIAASVHDMIQFASAHLQIQPYNFLKVASIHEMNTYEEPNALFHYYQDTFYGLGWYVMKNDKGQKVVWHEGGMMGASTTLKLYPKENTAIVLLTNTYNPAVCRSVSDLISGLVIENYTPTPINEVAEYKPVVSDTTFVGTWKGTMQIEEQEVPISMNIENETIQFSYLDNRFASSFLTDYSPLPFHSKLQFGLVNQGYFAGTGVGELSAANNRNCHQHLLSFRLLKNGSSLRGEVIYLAGGEREHYALPYSIALEKTGF
ncbi:MAG: serine hydrolase domain-containing protein [Croceivirga sp.]